MVLIGGPERRLVPWVRPFAGHPTELLRYQRSSVQFSDFSILIHVCVWFISFETAGDQDALIWVHDERRHKRRSQGPQWAFPEVQERPEECVEEPALVPRRGRAVAAQGLVADPTGRHGLPHRVRCTGSAQGEFSRQTRASLVWTWHVQR